MDKSQLIEGKNKFKYCIDDLIYSLEHVNEKYVKWKMGKANEEEKTIQAQEGLLKDKIDPKQRESYCERVFAYELYHQFRKLMCDNEKYSDLLFNGEQRKDESFFKDLFKELKDNDYVIPDLILHENLGNIEKHDGQVLYIEIKTINSDDVFLDLKKLSNLSLTALDFYYYIFIYVDGTIEDLMEKVEGVRKKHNYNELEDDILCICVKNNKACHITIKELKERIIIKNKI